MLLSRHSEPHTDRHRSAPCSGHPPGGGGTKQASARLLCNPVTSHSAPCTFTEKMNVYMCVLTWNRRGYVSAQHTSPQKATCVLLCTRTRSQAAQGARLACPNTAELPGMVPALDTSILGHCLPPMLPPFAGPRVAGGFGPALGIRLHMGCRACAAYPAGVGRGGRWGKGLLPPSPGEGGVLLQI